MSDYINLAYLQEYKDNEILLGIAGWDNAGTREINTTKTDHGINTSESIVNTKLANRYAIPLSNPSKALQAHVGNLALYYMYNINDMIPGDVKDDADRCLEWLDSIVKGDIDLIDSNNALYADKVDFVKTVNPINDSSYPAGSEGKFTMDGLFDQ